MTIHEIKQRNRERGHYFFEPASMRFFRSRVGSWTLRGEDDRVYFVTSEQFVGSDRHPHARRYTVRAMEADGVVNTVGEFQAFATLREAKRAAQVIAKKGVIR